MPPTAIITQPIAAIPFASLPTNVGLSGASSTASAGSIVAWEWTLRTAPTGSTASLSGATTMTPTLNNVSIPGCYVIDLNCQQTDLTWAWDHVDADAWLTVPVVMPTARVYVVATTQFAALSIPGVAERLTTASGAVNNLQAKWEGLFNEVDDLRGDIDSFIAGASFEDIYVDNVYELTPAHTIVMKDDVTSEGTITIDPAEALIANAVQSPIDTTLTISRPATLASNLSSVTLTNGVVTVAGGAGAQLDLYATYYSPRSTDAGIIVRGRGTHAADLFTNVIGEDTAAAGVTLDPSAGVGVLVKDGSITLGTGATVQTVGGSSMTIDADGALAVRGNGTLVLSSDLTDIDMDAATSINIAAAAGSIVLDANGAGSDVTITADDDITLTAADRTTIQHAVFTGASAAASALALSAITADDSGSVGIALNGVGNVIGLQATTVTLTSGATFLTDTIGEFNSGAGVTVDGVLCKDGLVNGVDLGLVPIIIYNGNVDASNAGTAGWETMLTVSLDAGLVANGGKLYVRATAHNAANANTKGFRIRLDGADVASNSHAGNNTPTRWDVYIRATGAATGRSDPTIFYGNSSVYEYTEIAITPTWANPLDLIFQIQGLSAIGDITMLAALVVYYPPEA